MNNVIILLCFLTSTVLFSQVGIGTTTPSDASMLEVSSSTSGNTPYKGFMPPRVTFTTDLTSIPAGINDAGLQVFVMETGCLNIWNGVSWESGSVPCVSIVKGSVVQFLPTAQSQAENVASVDFTFEITNPSPTQTIVLSISADDYADIDEATAQIVTIPANQTTHTSTEVFNITDDLNAETGQNVIFTATIVSGGLGTTTIGVNNTHILSIIDDDGTLELPFQESFEDDGNGVRYSLSIPSPSEVLSGTDYFGRAKESNLSGVVFSGSEDGDYIFVAQDIDNAPDSDGSLQTMIITGINITGGINLLFEVLIAEDDDGSNQDWDSGDGGNGDYFIVEYQIDGGGYQDLLHVRPESIGSNRTPRIDTDFDGLGDGTEIADTWADFSANLAGTGSLLDLRLSFKFNSGDEDIAIDNLRVTSN